MVVVGGATRLTGSGLSITQWRPIMGALPPLSHRAWVEAFALYQATPQYRLVNRDMSLSGFQFIFLWEWAHRLLGRLLGVAFILPFIIFVALRQLPRRLIWRCAVLFVLGGLQGLVGWWMVKSGLADRVSVAPERLAAHLALALALFVALIWTGLEAWVGPHGRRQIRPGPWTLASTIFAAAAYFQCLLGALVAGNRAGLVDNDWPLMGGRFVPDGYWQGGAWATLAHGLSAVQFNHRIFAYGLAAFGLCMATVALRSRETPIAVTMLTLGISIILALQVGLGIAALVSGMPLALAIAHQINGAVLLVAATALAWSSRQAERGIMLPLGKIP
jgi:cytochrome c oxidase assembly protein subunit 15